MFRSIQWRITFPFVLLIIAGMGVLGIYLVNLIGDSQLTSLHAQLENEARITAEASVPGFLSPDRGQILGDIADRLGGQINTRVTIVALDGNVLGDSDEAPAGMENHANRPEIREALERGLGESTRYSITLGEKMLYVAVPVVHQGEVLGIARVALPLTTIEGLVNRVKASIATAMAIAALLVILAAWAIARITTRPIREITAASRRIASGDLEQRISIQTGDEVEELARSFNEMSAKLKELVGTISGDKARLETILDNMADGVIMTDAEGNISLLNRALKRLFRITGGRDKPLIEVVRDYEVDELFKSCIATGETQDRQYESGTSRRFLRAIAVPVTGNKTDGVLILFQDLTDIRALQTTRRELIGNISHEFRTPLAGIKAMVETLQDGAVNDRPAAADFLSRIDSEVDRLTQMVAELTELTRIETGKAELRLEPADLNRLVEEIIGQLSPQAERQQLTVSKELDDRLPPVPMDAERIRQVIINLLHNAIKFTPPGGSVTITTRAGEKAATVAVADTGAGIARSDLPHIFERFYKADRSRSGGGTGMGLAIAKHVIGAHGGSIRVESEEGRGSTFSFDLPLP